MSCSRTQHGEAQARNPSISSQALNHRATALHTTKIVIGRLSVDETAGPITRGFIKRREAGIFPFYSGMFPLLLLINLYRVYRQILSNHPPTLP